MIRPSPLISKNLEILIESKTGSLGLPFPPHKKPKRKEEEEEIFNFQKFFFK
jgi:hypothetical protein